MQVELFNRRRRKTRIELAGAIHDYIEFWHNPRRRHSVLAMRTPDEIETAWLQTNPDAATPATGSQDRTAVSASACLRQAPLPTAGRALTNDGSEAAVTIIEDTNNTT